MKTLNIADGLKLPLDTVVQRKAIIAKNRVGKSNLGCAYVEEVHKAGVQSVVLDPKGDWYGIRSSANGKGEGLPFLVMGGDHGDVPLDPAAGSALGAYFGSTHVDVVLDVSDFSRRDLSRFGADFFEALYDARKKNRTPLNLVLEEAEDFAPQQVFEKDPNQYRCLGAVNKIAKKAGFLGIGLLLIAQRAASLNKNSLSQCDALFFMRTTAPQDIKAADAWLGDQDEEKRKELLSHIQGLPTGAAYVWAPEHGIFQKVQVRRRSTFDAGFTPKVGESKPEPKVKAVVDLTKLMGEMQAIVEKAKADDPKELRATIKRLEKELAAKQPEVRVEEREVEKPVPYIPQSLRDAIEKVSMDLQGAMEAAEEDIENTTVSITIPKLSQLSEKDRRERRIPGVSVTVQRPKPVPTKPVFFSSEAEKRHTKGNGMLSPPYRRILTVLAQRPEGVAIDRLAILSGYSVNGRFTNLLGQLRSHDMISPARVSPITITEKGVEELGPFEELPTGKELQQWWLERLSPSEQRIMQVLFNLGADNFIDITSLAEASGYSVNGRFTNLLGKLRTRGLVSPARQPIKAAPEFFEG